MLWPSKEEMTQVLIENIVGKGKKFDDLQDSWFTKHLIIALRESIWALLLVVRMVYENITVKGSSGSDLDDKGYDLGVDRNQATKAQHIVSLRKSAPVKHNTFVPDNFLLTTTPIKNNAPIKFIVMPEQNKYIPSGEQQVDVIVECIESGEIGNVSEGAINLVAQAGFDSIGNSILHKCAVEKEKDESYRDRILARKRNPIRGGVPDDWERWAKEVSGVSMARIFRVARGPGTVDIVIWGSDGSFPSQGLIDDCQTYLDAVTPADIADGGILVVAPEPIPIDIVLSNVSLKMGYEKSEVISILEQAFTSYFQSEKAANGITKVDCIVTARFACDPKDSDMAPIIKNFILDKPEDISLNGRQFPVLSSITIL